jgi:RTA1 like protein
MLPGLASQVFILVIFILLLLDFARKAFRQVETIGKGKALNSRHQELRQSSRFRGFLIALSFATLCIITRSVYHVVELVEGWNGRLIKVQRCFIELEGPIVAAGVLALNAFHLGFCFHETV